MKGPGAAVRRWLRDRLTWLGFGLLVLAVRATLGWGEAGNRRAPCLRLDCEGSPDLRYLFIAASAVFAVAGVWLLVWTATRARRPGR